jgi:predicted dithiol-disulfide oxidoreductase (DUF899 family)
MNARSAAVDVDVALAHVGRTILPDAVDVEVDLDLDFDFDSDSDSDFDSDPYSGRACLQGPALSEAEGCGLARHQITGFSR